MDQRNWLELSRKLVDRYDFDYTLQGMSKLLGEYALSFFGEGVLSTTIFPNPFPLVLSGSSLGGTVGTGIGYDYRGFYTAIQAGTSPFVISPANASNPRWDLLVIRYKQQGTTSVPKPSDPITLISLNLIDSFELAVVPGTPAGSPVYPAKGVADIILGGIQVPANATIGTQCTLDLSIREIGLADLVKYPVIKEEQPTGAVNGTNVTFTLSKTPIANGLILTLDGVERTVTSEFTISGTTITFVTAPVLGQTLRAWYVVMDASSVNPLAAQQETPSGAVNGVNDTFALAGRPANKDATIVWVDGVMSPATEWSLIQSPTGSQVKFGPSFIPVIGQSVYCFYFVNPASVGTAPVSGGSGGGSYTPYGSTGAPLVVTATGGVVTNASQRELQFLNSPGGEVAVTANPQVSPGSVIGQEMLLRGTSDTNYPVFSDGNGLSLNGLCKLTLNQTLPLFWDGSLWVEITRRN
jgi:hypothetical protein